MHRLGVERARQLAVRAQLLDGDRPTDLLDVVDRLAFLQQAPRYRQPREWLAADQAFAADVLARLRADGPLLSEEIPDTAAVPWASTGWTGNRNVTQVLEVLAGRGEAAISGRRGKQRLWDLAERVYPADVEVVPLEEAERERDRRRLRALGIARARTDQSSAEADDVGEAGEPAVVEGVPGEWRVDPAQLDRSSAGRTALLSPFDRLVHDRRRALELFGFEYTLEMYKPAAARRWGCFALPVLHHDRLVGKVDASADRRAGTLTVAAVHQDVPFTPAMAEHVDAELSRPRRLARPRPPPLSPTRGAWRHPGFPDTGVREGTWGPGSPTSGPGRRVRQPARSARRSSWVRHTGDEVSMSTKWSPSTSVSVASAPAAVAACT